MSVEDWRNDQHRAPRVRNNLARRQHEMKTMAGKCRKAFNQAYMGELANYLGDAYDEAASVFQRKLDECEETPS